MWIIILRRTHIILVSTHLVHDLLLQILTVHITVSHVLVRVLAHVVLPLNVLHIHPHAHYQGRHMRVPAVLHGGQKIKDAPAKQIRKIVETESGGGRRWPRAAQTHKCTTEQKRAGVSVLQVAVAGSWQSWLVVVGCSRSAAPHTNAHSRRLRATVGGVGRVVGRGQFRSAAFSGESAAASSARVSGATMCVCVWVRFGGLGTRARTGDCVRSTPEYAPPFPHRGRAMHRTNPPNTVIIRRPRTGERSHWTARRSANCRNERKKKTRVPSVWFFPRRPRSPGDKWSSPCEALR